MDTITLDDPITCAYVANVADYYHIEPARLIRVLIERKLIELADTQPNSDHLFDLA